jgi:TonB family protein
MRRIFLLGLLLVLAATGMAFAAEGEGTYSDPLLIKSSRVAPDYPPAALAARYGASVTVAAHVLADGTVADTQVMNSTRPNLGFEEAAADAISQWRFHPATQDGDVVESISVFTLDFSAPGTRSRPNPYVNTGFLTSQMAPPGFDMGPGRPLVMPDVSTASADTPQVGLNTPSLPPCQEVGCMYDRTKLVPKQRRNVVAPGAGAGR